MMKMKKFYHNLASMIAAAAVAAAAVSCAADDELVPPPSSAAENSESQISLNVSLAEGSRTSLNTLAEDLIRWHSNDATKMGLCADIPISGYSIYYLIKSSKADFNLEEDAHTARTGTFSFSSSNGAVNKLVRAYYPFVNNGSLDDMYQGKEVTFTIPTALTQYNAASESKWEMSNGYTFIPMISDDLSGTTVSGSNAEVQTKMHVLSSIIAFYVYDSSQAYADEVVKSITFQSTNGKYVAGPTTVKLTDLKVGELPVLTGNSVETVVKRNSAGQIALKGVISKATSKPLYMSVIPGDFAGKITVQTDVASYIFPFSATKHFGRAEVKDMLLNLSNANVQRILLSEIVTPVVNLTKLERSQSGSYCNTTLTIVKGNDAVVGFYALTAPKTNADLTREEVMAGDVYHFGDPDNDMFELQADGKTVKYRKKVNLYSPTQFSFGVIPFGKYDNYGELKGDYGYGNKSATTTLDL